MEQEGTVPPRIECCEEVDRGVSSGQSEAASESQRAAEEMTPGRRGRGGGVRGGQPVVGSYVMKNFADGAGALLGKVVSSGGRFFAAVYEDGRREELDACEVRRLLIPAVAEVEALEAEEMGLRKRKLEEMVAAAGTPTRSTRRKVDASAAPAAPAVPAAPSVPAAPAVVAAASVEGSERRSGAASVVMSGLDMEEDADSSTDSCECISAPVCSPASSQITSLQVLPLPPSSGGMGVPEESVACLLSVYNFLRSFSLQLFLCPFGLSDFVGSLNLTVQNSLLDAIHVSLMRVLKRHLEILSSEGSQVALRCLRCYDWTMLDSLTWPVFLLEYLYSTGNVKGQEWEGFCYGISDGEYYELPPAVKLRILQILCDAVVESEELRVELESRENMDEEREYTSNNSFPHQANLRRGRPRYSQTSAFKGLVKDNAISPAETTSSSNKLPTDTNEPDVAQDGNSDECRLCGMDGTLVCCDGCPSAYHSRCIGLIKAFLPDGPWFCPECMANKIGPTFSKISTGIRGADIFGTDPYGRVFLGTSNYLLVHEASPQGVGPVSRYYNQNDILKVLKSLCATEQSSTLYADICKGIVNYWAIPVAVNYSEPERTDSVAGQVVLKEDSQVVKPLCASSEKTVINVNAGENNASNLTINTQENRALSNVEGNFVEVVANDSLDSVNQTDHPNAQKFSRASNGMSANKLTENANDALTVVKGNQFFSTQADHSGHHFVYGKLPNQTGNESAISFGLFGQPTNPTDLKQQRSPEKSSMLDFGCCASRIGNGAFKDDADSQVLKATGCGSMSCESAQTNHIHGEKATEPTNGSFILGASFKPQAYVNQYALGDVAASAAANLAVLASEESKSVPNASYNHRKAVSANIALQMKAFSKATMHFMWPSCEKKNMEAPRERCGWCIACKGASTNKKGCLLNLAATNAIKGAVRGHGGHRPLKISESHASTIATHILHMEESLRGLIVGPLADARHNKQWRKLVKEASTCRVLKFLLLELERNIRGVAFSGDWFRLLDDRLVEFPAAQLSTSVMASAQKRGPGRRRKQSTTSEMIPSSDHESWNHVNWWRGGRVSRTLFQRGILPGLLAKKAARQGGLKCVSGVTYSDNFEIPRRTQQFAWRAVVETTKSASQLALQVRCLDAHIRWKDLVRPEQIPVEGKAAENEASAFRNAVICEKRNVGNKTRYALDFGDQKHLPVRVMKNVLEAEASQDGKEKLWFSENNVPLYLVKEYEEKAKDVPLPPKVLFQRLPAFQRRQLKSYRSDIFSYLLFKEEKPRKCSCASCPSDVLLRDAVRCKACQGYCHKNCLAPPSPDMEVDSDCTLICKRCNIIICSALVENQVGNVAGQLSFQQENRIDKKVEQSCYQPTQQPRVFNMDIHSDRRPASDNISEQKSKRGTYLYHGLIWKKKNSNAERGEQFRQEHIIPRGNADSIPLTRPVCVLCSKDYNPDAMYISCERCSRWVHADAVLLEEDQVSDLIGYKCGKCRRKSSPPCPYADSDYKKPGRKPLKECHAEESQGSVLQSVSQNKLKPSNSPPVAERHLLSVRSVGSVSQLPLEYNLLTSVHRSLRSPDLGVFHVNPSDRSLHGSCGKTEVLCRGATPVTLTMKQGSETHGSCTTTQDVNKMILAPGQASLSSHGNWNVPGVGNPNEIVEGIGTRDLRDRLLDSEVNFEGMESEPPQTYFSFTELLASGDDQLDQLLDMPIEDMSDPWVGVATAGLGLDDARMAREEGMMVAAEPAAEPTAGGANNQLPAVSGAPCQKCGISIPPVDLTCEICELSIHRGCSLWDGEADVASSSDAAPWRCVNCREWE